MRETYLGLIKSPTDALLVFEACRIGLLRRVNTRLSDAERGKIRPGSVFVWDERESGMRRWTDGKSWSASRVSGAFLTYREMEGRETHYVHTFFPPASVSSNSDEDGDAGMSYKPNGLVKQSFSIITSQGQKLHLISYHTKDQQLVTPSTDSTIRHIQIPSGLYPDPTPLPGPTKTFQKSPPQKTLIASVHDSTASTSRRSSPNDSILSTGNNNPNRSPRSNTSDYSNGPTTTVPFPFSTYAQNDRTDHKLPMSFGPRSSNFAEPMFVRPAIGCSPEVKTSTSTGLLQSLEKDSVDSPTKIGRPTEDVRALDRLRTELRL